MSTPIWLDAALLVVSVALTFLLAHFLGYRTGRRRADMDRSMREAGLVRENRQLQNDVLEAWAAAEEYQRETQRGDATIAELREVIVSLSETIGSEART